MPETLIIADTPPRRCRSCQAVNPDTAKCCWMCRAPLGAPAPVREGSQAHLVEMVDRQRRSDPLSLQLAPLLALPLAAIVVWGVFQYDTMWGIMVSPAIIIATLAALGHQLLLHGIARPQTPAARAGVAGSSLLVGLLAGAGTFVATILVLIIVAVVMVISLIMAIAEFCGLR